MWDRLRMWILVPVYGVALGGLAVLTAYLSFSLFVRRGVTPVPNVVGLELEEAGQRLEDRGLRWRYLAEEDRFDEEVEAERVLEQRPAGGNLAKRGGLVDVVLSRGKRLVTVPDVSALALPAAQVTLAGVGLEVGMTLQVFASEVATGQVVAQQPRAGTLVGRGQGVKLFLAAGSPSKTYLMPDLINRDYREVRHFLEFHGFRVGSVKFEPYEGVLRSLVLRQFPLPGHPLRQGDVISLVVAAVEEPSAGIEAREEGA